MKAEFENESWEIDDWEIYKEFVPPDLKLTKIVADWDTDDYWAGYADLYVFQEYGGMEYGVEMWRQGGKHADYDEVYEKAYARRKSELADWDEEVWTPSESDYVTLLPLETEVRTHYVFKKD